MMRMFPRGQGPGTPAHRRRLPCRICGRRFLKKNLSQDGSCGRYIPSASMKQVR